jgi:cytochrome c peroxidase
MKLSVVFSLIVVMTLILSCAKQHEPTLDEELEEAIISGSRTGSLDYFIFPEEGEFDKLPNQDPANPLTPEKAKLGQLLFFEPGLAQNPSQEICYETYSCSSCHIPSRGFLPGRMQGIADGAVGFGNFGTRRLLADGYSEDEIDAQGTRPMTVMNVTYMTNTLWSGTFGANDKNVGTEYAWTGLAEVNHTGYAGLEAQNIEGFDLHRLEINDRVLYDFGYAALFDEAFPDIPKEQRYTPETASFAMGAFLRSILTNQAPLQQYLKGDRGALSEQQKRGAKLFFGKANCIACHNSPSFSNMQFFALGTADMYQFGGLNTSADDPRNRGRGMFTGREEDNYKFKVPQLYNLKEYASFFHGSSKYSIADVLDFKMEAKSENPNVSDEDVALNSFSLSKQQRSDLLDFLTNALYDNDMERYLPRYVLSGYCFPNNDDMSKEDMGCQ